MPDYKKVRTAATVSGVIGALIVFLFSFLVGLTPINIHDEGFWVTVIIALAIGAGLYAAIIYGKSAFLHNEIAYGNTTWYEVKQKSGRPLMVPLVLFVLFFILILSGSVVINAGRYASILNVEDAVFADDLAETLNNDSIALMDTKSAKMLGDREIGSLGNVVSQYNVSDDYTQIDYQGKPKKVAALDYAGFFKWIGNKQSGIPGFVMVDPVSMSASYQQCENGMIYVPSAYLWEDAGRVLRLHYPTLMFENLHFEVDESGHPYYIASVTKKTVSLFGGRTVNGAVMLDPVTGETAYYDMDAVPTWADDIYDGNILCEQYNWYGNLKNGFINSMIGKKGCKRVTTYSSDDSDDDDVPVSDYGYVAKDGDIWIYTGVTSVNGDSSNIGFLLANERTGESHYYNIAGADEKSAMAAAEGEVQEKRYQASFPSLINVDGNPTYIMVLKDASGLVKLYATVNVEQYNLVTTATKQKECIQKYRALLGLADAEGDVSDIDVDEILIEATDEADITIAEIKYIDIDGNTYIYLITTDNTLYRAKASLHESMLLLKAGDQVHITNADKEIVTCEPIK